MTTANTGVQVQVLGQGHDRLLRAEREGAVLGQARLRAGIGLDRPRWWYHVGCAVHAAPALDLFHRQPTLLLGNDLTGAAELDAIELTDPQAADARTVLDALLSAALQAVRATPQVHGVRLIVELPGVRDASNRSPFWHGLGRHFHGAAGDIDAEAARFGAEAWRCHVAALLPRQLLYTSFLPADAQAAIGAVRADAAELHAALAAAGLRFAGHVRIDDGGPVMEA
jgi:arginine N-succinyltransferase